MRVYSILRKCALVILLNAKLSKFVCPSFIAAALCDEEELERREKLVSLIIKISFDKMHFNFKRLIKFKITNLLVSTTNTSCQAGVNNPCCVILCN